MKASTTIGRRIALGTGFLCIMLALSVIFAVAGLRSLMRLGDDIVGDSLPGLSLMATVSRQAAEGQIRLERLVRASTPAEKAEIVGELTARSQKVTEAMKAYAVTVKDEDDRRLFGALSAARTGYLRARADYIVLIDRGDRVGAEALLKGKVKEAYTVYTHAAETLTRFNADQAADSGARLSSEVRRDDRIFIVGGLLAVLVGIGLGAASVVKTSRVLRSISAQLEDGAVQVSSAASQVAGSSGTLAQGATEQAASLEETSASLEEMAGMTRRNAENAAKAKEVAGVARVAADAGHDQMTAMHGAMEDIRTASEQITQILKTIDEIAFQTNILALNAAVEAARAGDAGAGFAVVADEVRSLAQRAAGAARETAEKIEASVVKSRLGVTLSADVARSFEAIQSHVRNLDGLVAEIAAASAEQSQGIEQVSKAVTEMDRVIQANASGAEETASAAEELNAQSGAMKELVDGLVALSGGRVHMGIPPAA